VPVVRRSGTVKSASYTEKLTFVGDNVHKIPTFAFQNGVLSSDNSIVRLMEPSLIRTSTYGSQVVGKKSQFE
jgi:hypothetical protein